MSATKLQLIAPPPLLYLGTLVIGAVMQLLSPWSLGFNTTLTRGIGVVMFLLGVTIVRWSFATMKHRGTSGNPRTTPTALITGGPFRFSRNPIYVAMTLMALGIGFFIASVWMLLCLIPLLIVMHWGVILREEQLLIGIFGDTYRQYCQQVRRWI